jgi:hypothetical protein
MLKILASTSTSTSKREKNKTKTKKQNSRIALSPNTHGRILKRHNIVPQLGHQPRRELPLSCYGRCETAGVVLDVLEATFRTMDLDLGG